MNCEDKTSRNVSFQINWYEIDENNEHNNNRHKNVTYSWLLFHHFVSTLCTSLYCITKITYRCFGSFTAIHCLLDACMQYTIRHSWQGHIEFNQCMYIVRCMQQCLQHCTVACSSISEFVSGSEITIFCDGPFLFSRREGKMRQKIMINNKRLYLLNLD